MGYIKHHSIIVTGSPESILEAREKCIAIFAHELIDDFDNPEQIISSICLGLANSQHSFFIAPDGSKEGWETSDNCDNAREVFLQWLKEKSICEFIEIRFGGDDDVNFITNYSK